VGWGLRKAHWGQGNAFEAASACIDYAFDELGWNEVTHLIEDANTPSQTLATRHGLQPSEYVRLPGALSDVQVRVWRQSKTQWLAGK
jgi:RimJ/RimL family protein N-acetyltransferase